MSLGPSITELIRSETALADHLGQICQRHRADHEIHHVARELARWSAEHADELMRIGRRYGVGETDDTKHASGIVGRTVRKAATLATREPEPPSRLLRDLRDLYRDTAGVSVDWELLGQGAQAEKDDELLELTKRCHPDTLRQLRWANAMLKTMSPQILASQ